MTLALLPLATWAGGSAFINSTIVLKDAPQAIAASKAMKDEFKERESALNASFDEIQKLEESYNKDSVMMSEAKRKQAEENILAKKREFRLTQQSLKEDVQLRRQEKIRTLQLTITSVIKAYGEKKGYDFIFSEGVAYAAESVDITDEILEELKKLKKQ